MNIIYIIAKVLLTVVLLDWARLGVIHDDTFVCHICNKIEDLFQEKKEKKAYEEAVHIRSQIRLIRDTWYDIYTDPDCKYIYEVEIMDDGSREIRKYDVTGHLVTDDGEEDD